MGVLEALSPEGSYFGYERLSALLNDSCTLTAEALCNAVIKDVRTFQKNKLADDVTVLTLKRLS